MSDSNKLATELEAREVAEDAREKDWEKATFARGLYDGRYRLCRLQNSPR